MTPNPKSLFLGQPKKTSSGKIYQGRFACHDIQWTGKGDDFFGTFTITAEELADAAIGGLLWTDQDVQRGIRPEITTAKKELSLSEGYPDPATYVFDQDNADDIVDKLLKGARLFLSPLVWNLRPGLFQAYRDNKNSALYIYDGKIYLPDSHHRQQAIVKAVRIWREAPRDYPKFSGDREFKVEVYFLSRQDEGNYFFDKNQRPTPTSKSKAYDLTTEDDLSVLAKRTIENSQILPGNVNRVTDRLISKNNDLITLSTLREMMRTFASTDHIDESELDGMAAVAGAFFDKLSRVRPELGHLSVSDRQKVRSESLVDAAVMMHGYASLMRNYNLDRAKQGSVKAEAFWDIRLRRLSPDTKYKLGRWSGDLFDRNNPLWVRSGIMRPSRDGRKLTITNTGASRAEAGRILRQLVTVTAQPSDLSFLLER